MSTPLKEEPPQMDAKIKAVLEAACAYTDLADEHRAHESKRAVLMQEAAAASRRGDIRTVRQKKGQADLMAVEVFDFSNAHDALSNAVAAYRKAQKKATPEGTP